MTRSYVYRQKKNVKAYVESLEEPAKSGKTIIIDKRFIRKAILTLILENSSSYEGVQRNLEALYGEHVSIGFISAVVNEAGDRAQKFDDSIDLKGIRQAANDEIFQGNTPIFTSIDPETTYILMLEEATDRKTETWEIYANDMKNRGLELERSINDGGAGLIAGIKKAFPDLDIQRDTFHALNDVGKEAAKIEKKAYGALKEEEDLKSRVQRGRSRQKNQEQLTEAIPKAEKAVRNYDVIAILFEWLKELLGFSGLFLEDATNMIEFVLNELKKYEEEYPDLVKACDKTRKILPDLLSFISFLERKMEQCAIELGIPPDAFRIMYRQLAFDMGSQAYQEMEYKLVLMLMEKYDDTRLAFQQILDETKKASSLVENLNGRIRVYIDLKRRVPTKFFILMKVYFNTRRYRRSRIKKRVGKSPLELLTGKPQPSFLEVLGY